MQASEAVRLSVLGVYEIQDSRFPLSDMQLAALAVVGRTRWRGTINADLANRLGIAYRNFYYIVKVSPRYPNGLGPPHRPLQRTIQRHRALATHGPPALTGPSAFPSFCDAYCRRQNLETRKLVVKNPVVFAPPGATVTVSSVLHLPRFQPAVKLGPGQMFKVSPRSRPAPFPALVVSYSALLPAVPTTSAAAHSPRVAVFQYTGRP